MNQSPAQNSKLILAAMIFAVSMTFIDQTIVAIAIPTIQDDLTLSATGVQWIINGYLLSLSALFAFGGRLADIAGHRRMVVLGVVIFATASALCGATPSGSLDETWLIVFRVIQGAGAAIMFPAALAIVLNAFPVSERGKAMALFFTTAGLLTAIGPVAGGYLVEWSWRAVFLLNLPLAALVVTLPLAALETEAVVWNASMIGAMAWSVIGLTLGDIDGIIQVGTAVSVYSVRDYHQRASTLRRPHLLITELPNRIVKRRLFSGFLDRIDGAIQQLEPVSEILTQIYFVIEGGKQYAIATRTNYSLNKVHGRLLFKL